MTWLHILAWLACAVCGFFATKKAQQSLASRGIYLKSFGLLSFPTRIAVYVFFICAAQWFVFNLYVHGRQVAHPWVVLAPAYFLNSVTLLLMIIDTRWKLLPNRVLYPTAGILLPLLSVLAIIRPSPMALVRIWVLALIALVVLVPLTLLGLGMGDVKLAVVLSAWLGLYGWLGPLIMLALASLMGGIFSLVIILLKRASLRSYIAFGPWLICAAYITWILYFPTFVS